MAASTGGNSAIPFGTLSRPRFLARRRGLSMAPSVAEAAAEYARRGFAPIPVPHREKRPVLPEWQKLRLTLADIPQYFNGRGQNVGLLLGVGGLTDVDLDASEAAAAARELLPDTAFRYGRESKPGSHAMYVCEPTPTTRQYKCPLTGASLAELRGLSRHGETGAQTIVPPSTHPSGEPVRFEPGCRPEPARVSAAELERAVSRVAAAALLARHFPGEGSRNEAFLALAGLLARAGWSQAETTQFVRAIYRCLWGAAADLRQAEAEVAHTFERFREGGELTGYPTLAELIHEKVLKTALRWLGMETGAAPRAADGRKLTQTEPSNDSSLADPEDRFVRLPLTDSGNGERLVLRHGKDLRYCHPQKTWWIWSGRRWEPDRTGRVMELAKAVVRELYQAAWSLPDAERKKQTALWAIRSESTDRKRAALVSAQSEPGIPILPEQFDADPWTLNCLNGTIDLRTGNLRPHRREDYCTRMAPVRYDPAARSELWERFLEEACGGDRQLIEFLQRAVGYSLTGSTAEEKLFFVHGPAASGKSTFLEAIRSVLGDYARTADFESFIQRLDAGGIRNDIAELAGRRFVVGMEVDEGRRLAEALVKLLTGGDTVRARFLYQEAFEFVPQFKLWLAANHAPRVRHDDSALWRRILRVPFEHVIPPDRRDPSVKARLKDVEESGPAILAWAVEGCLRWQQDGLAVPDVVQEATRQYQEDMDPLRDFIADCCVLAPNAWTPAAKLREAYETYCRENGEKRLIHAREFAAALRARGCEPHRRAKGVRGWCGIGLLAHEE
jgi:putative DNA primase/helicase